MTEPLPQLTWRSLLGDAIAGAKALFVSPDASKLVVPMVVPVASIICKSVISLVAYTEIDFSTYMQQIEMVNAGARDYLIIEGDTGPIVYPAGFVKVYQMLYWLTDGGVNITRAQFAFGYLYAITLLITCVVYTMVDGFKPWPLYLLLLSKRLVSIYVLRLFNDCFTTLAMVCTVLVLQVASYWSLSLSDVAMLSLCAVAADIYSLALSVKMNALLYLPAFLLVVYFLVGERILHLSLVALVIPLVQVLIGWEFLVPMFWDDEARRLRWNYLTQAFDFRRKFLYEWSINWQFVSEETFLSDEFAYALLAGHIVVLGFFAFTRYLSPKVTGKSLQTLVTDAAAPFTKTVLPSNLLLGPSTGPKLIMLIFSSSNMIGVLFSRSLHYQFLSWYAWQFPFMLYMTRAQPVLSVVMFFVHEWCWNKFPPDASSSQMLVAMLGVTLLSVWGSTDSWFEPEPVPEPEETEMADAVDATKVAKNAKSSPAPTVEDVPKSTKKVRKVKTKVLKKQ